MSSDQQWDVFCEKAASLLRDAVDNKVMLEVVSNFFERDTHLKDPDVRRYVEYIVWEIDGSPDSYRKVLALFERQASERDMKKALNLA